MTHLDRIAARLAPLCLSHHLIRVDVDFVSTPLGLTITLEPDRPGQLRDKRLGRPLLGWEPFESELREELAAFNERTREPDSWYIRMTLTVYADGTSSFGASRHAPLKR